MIRTSVLAAATLAGAAVCLLAVPTSEARAVPACGDAAIEVTATAARAEATGSGFLILRFKNRTAHSCSLYGYPGLDALSASGAALPVAGDTGRSGHRPRTVVLLPGRFASAGVDWTGDPATGRRCRLSAAIAVTPAGTGHAVRLGRSVGLCHLRVHAIVAGRGGTR